MVISTDWREERILRLLLRSHAWVRHVVVALGLELSVRIWSLDKVLLKWIDIVWVMQVIDDELRVLFVNASVFEEVLDLNNVHAHFDHLLKELLLALSKEVFLLVLIATKGPLLREFLLELTFALFSRWHWYDVVLSHEVEKLSWDFHESFLCKKMWIVLEFIERNELHDISGHILPICCGI